MFKSRGNSIYFRGECENKIEVCRCPNEDVVYYMLELLNKCEDEALIDELTCYADEGE